MSRVPSVKVIRMFPNRGSAYRLVETVCAETHGERSTAKYYLIMDEVSEWKVDRTADEPSAQRTTHSKFEASLASPSPS